LILYDIYKFLGVLYRRCQSVFPDLYGLYDHYWGEKDYGRKEKPFSTADRVVVWILANACVVGGGLGVALSCALALPLGLASAGGLAVGTLYAIAARRGRPL
jgi:hypothetical protein